MTVAPSNNRSFIKSLLGVGDMLLSSIDAARSGNGGSVFMVQDGVGGCEGGLSIVGDTVADFAGASAMGIGRSASSSPIGTAEYINSSPRSSFFISD